MPILKSVFKDRFKVSEARLTHCRKCDEFNQETAKCGVCGCNMDYKTLWPWAECPIGKWGMHESEPIDPPK